MKIYLVRHGEKENFIGDPALTELGIKQARLTGEYFKSINIGHIFASPLKRTQMTASIIGKHLNLDFKIDDRLRERMNWGDRINQSFDDFLKEWNKGDLDRDYKPNNGDSSRETGNRFKKFLDEFDIKENILVVTHGGTIGDFLRNNFEEKKLPMITTNNRYYVKITECSITTLNKNKDIYELLEVAKIEHLNKA